MGNTTNEINIPALVERALNNLNIKRIDEIQTKSNLSLMELESLGHLISKMSIDDVLKFIMIFGYHDTLNYTDKEYYRLTLSVIDPTPIGYIGKLYDVEPIVKKMVYR